MVTLATSLAVVGGLIAGCSSKPSPSAGKFCAHYAAATRVGASLQHLDTVAIPDIQRQVQGADAEVEAALKVAPAAVAPSTRDLAAALHTFRLAVDKATTRAQIDQAAQAYRTEATTLVESQAQVNSWTRAHCGLAPNAPSTTTAPSTP